MTETFDLLVSKLVSQLYVTRATFTSVLGVSAFFESGQALNGQTDRQTDRQWEMRPRTRGAAEMLYRCEN